MNDKEIKDLPIKLLNQDNVINYDLLYDSLSEALDAIIDKLDEQIKNSFSTSNY